VGCLWYLVGVFFSHALFDAFPDTIESFNMGQACTSGSRIFVQEGIHDAFVAQFTAFAKGLSEATGDPFELETQHGPQVSKVQFDVRVALPYFRLRSHLRLIPISV